MPQRFVSRKKMAAEAARFEIHLKGKDQSCEVIFDDGQGSKWRSRSTGSLR